MNNTIQYNTLEIYFDNFFEVARKNGVTGAHAFVLFEIGSHAKNG